MSINASLVVLLIIFATAHGFCNTKNPLHCRLKRWSSTNDPELSKKIQDIENAKVFLLAENVKIRIIPSIF